MLRSEECYGKQGIPNTVYAMSFDASRAIFNASFLGLAKQCYNIDADTIMDQRRLGDITYLTFYDKIIGDKKRKASSIDN